MSAPQEGISKSNTWYSQALELPAAKKSGDDLSKIQVWTDSADRESTVKYDRENNHKNQSPGHRQVISQRRKKLPHFTQVPARYYGIFASAGKHILTCSERGLAQQRKYLQKPHLESAVILVTRGVCTESIFYIDFTRCQSCQMAQKHLSSLQWVKCFHNRSKLSDIFKLQFVLSEPIRKTNEIINFSSS